MQTTAVETDWETARNRYLEERGRANELAELSAHLSAATARFVELVWTMHEKGDCDGGELAGFVAYRCGVTRREAGEYLRVAEALQELPATRTAFSRGELTFTKVRALTRVATASTEEVLIDLAGALTASQLERALRVYRRIAVEDARETHELEFVDYHFDEDGSLYLRARLAAEDGTMLVKALDAARERVLERRREQRAAAARAAEEDDASSLHAQTRDRSLSVETFAELAGTALAASPGVHSPEPARIVVHVDAAALTTDGRGRSELEDGPEIAPETARRLGCDAELVAQVERDGLPLGVARKRRTVPPALRRLLEARDDQTCCFPGCERRRHLQAHHRTHWAHGGETSLDNLVLLCFHHHRLVHEGGFTIEDDPQHGLRFRNRYGVLSTASPPRPPPGWAGALLEEHDRRGLEIGARTNQNGGWSTFDLGAAVSAISAATGFAT
jgi:hypothetical protein